MNKLISRNPVLRFKNGLKILKFLNAGQLTYHGNPVTKKGAIFIPWDPVKKKYDANIQLTNVELDTKIGKGNSNGRVYKSADGNWYLNGKKIVNFINSKPTKSTTSTENSFRTAFNNARNANQREFEWNGTRYNTRRNGETEEQWLNNIGASSNTAPETNVVLVANPNWTYDGDTKGVGFVPTQQVALQATIGPSFYGKGITDFNRGNIRGFRNQEGGFRNVDEYYNWLNNNQDSDLYKLWNNVLEGMDEETRRNTFNQIMNLFGISGNLGRRDSQRLANVLNILRDLGVNGSANLTAFMDAYDSYSVGDDGTVYSSPWVRSLFERFNAQPSNNTNFAEQGKQFLLRRSPHSYAEFGIKRPGYMTYGEYLTTPSAYTQRTGLDTLNNTNGFRQTITNWLNQNPRIYNNLANIFTTYQPSVATPTYIPNYNENNPLTYRYATSIYKQGGLISRNPVKQFKTNFRKGAL